jgi:hypothetical protein
MNLFFLLLPAKKQKHDSEEHIVTTIHEPLHDTCDGSEFLDDAIRMKEQPLMYIEENTSTQYGEGQV